MRFFGPQDQVGSCDQGPGQVPRGVSPAVAAKFAQCERADDVIRTVRGEGYLFTAKPITS